MNEDVIADFKQFITATVTQATSGMATKDDLANMATKDDIARLDKKIDDKADEILEAIGETMVVSTEIVDSGIADLKHRVTILEAKTA